MRKSVLNLIIGLTFVWLATACSSAPAAPAAPATTAPVPTPTVSASDEAAGASAEKSVQDLTADDLAKIVAERTPIPSPTPGPVDRALEQITAGSGLAGRSFLGLSGRDWINLGVAALVVLIGSLLVIPLLFGLLTWAVRRTKTQFDDDFLATIGRELRWLVVIILIGSATFRLKFLSEGGRLLFVDVLFILRLVVLMIIALRLVAFAADHYMERWKSEEDRKRWGPIMTTLKRLGYIVVSLIALSIASSHFGINVTFPSVVIISVTVVIAIAAKTTIDDAISGFLLLVGQPFRIDDAIFMKELDTRGDVVEIGVRTTRIRTRDSREVIIPNSLIAASQIVNYTYPDPSFRVQIDIGVAYNTDFDQLQQIIIEAVRGVDGVLPDKPVNVLFMAFGDSALQIRVRWWVDNVNNRNHILSRVNVALLHALEEAGIDTPNPTYDLNLKMEGENESRAAQALSSNG